MLRRALHIFCSLWLATLLLFGGTPAEALHAFAHHRDTVHRHDVSGPVADTQHHHCQFLGFHLMPFAAPYALPPLRPAPIPEYNASLSVQDERAAQQTIALREGRGPPVV